MTIIGDKVVILYHISKPMSTVSKFFSVGRLYDLRVTKKQSALYAQTAF